MIRRRVILCHVHGRTHIHTHSYIYTTPGRYTHSHILPHAKRLQDSKRPIPPILHHLQQKKYIIYNKASLAGLWGEVPVHSYAQSQSSEAKPSSDGRSPEPLAVSSFEQEAAAFSRTPPNHGPWHRRWFQGKKAQQNRLRLTLRAKVGLPRWR